MKETYVFVVDETTNEVIHKGVLIDTVSEKIGGKETYGLIKGPDNDDHWEIHPINRLFYKTIGH